jgi:uracil-DNA glycosylase
MDLNMLFGDEWYNALKRMLKTNYWKALGQKIAGERIMYNIFPEKGSDTLFKAFRTTPLSKVRVVILGQDPYQDGSYDGFAFSNRDDGQKISNSLRNILKEVESDVYDGFQIDQNPDLTRWAEQGVLLLNRAHTVRKKNPGSHLEYWSRFTNEVLSLLSKQDRPIVWILWGKKAEGAVGRIMKNPQHIYVKTPHPSEPGFKGSKPFTRTNKFLERHGKEQIKW